ncbi:MAG: transposase, partial [Cyanobacteria bacterium P01_A01_bin.83]
MARLSKEDLTQMNRGYFQSLSKERLVEVADNLHLLAVEQWEKINSDSDNSSQPPSSDNPFKKEQKAHLAAQQSNLKRKQKPESSAKRKAGRQKGAKGFGRSQILKIDEIIPHYPSECNACNQTKLVNNSKPYMGHQVLELEKTEGGLRIVCQLHHYYQASCSCGHQSKSQPGVGITSTVKGRTRDLKLSEYVLVGSNLASLIASLGVRYRLSRTKIREFLTDWLGIKLSIGTIDRCIREAGIACEPVVEELLAQLQVSQIRPIDETPWYQKGKL